MSKTPTIPDWPHAMVKVLAAEYSGRSVRDLERAVASGRIVARRDGKRLLFLRPDLDAYLEALPTSKPTDVSRPGGQ